MRYSLAGGFQSNGENGSGLDYCIRAADRYSPITSMDQEIREAMEGWMDSPGHRRNTLDPQHKRVNIGIAWDRYNTAMYQHFEGGYVEYDRLPTISDGILALSGQTKNGVRFRQERDIGLQIYYDHPPSTLTRGQLARTYCYDNGRLVASLREPLTGGYRWTTHEFTTTHDPCPSPYDVAGDTPAPRSYAEAHRAWQQAYNASQSRQPQSITVPWITAKEWTAQGHIICGARRHQQDPEPVRAWRLYRDALGRHRRREGGHLAVLHVPRCDAAGHLPAGPAVAGLSKVGKPCSTTALPSQYRVSGCAHRPISDEKIRNHSEMVRQLAVSVDVADYPDRLGRQVVAQRDMVDGSFTL